MYYKFLPELYLNSAPENISSGVDILYSKFASIQDGLEAARLTGICLREMNWTVLECRWFGLSKKRVMLRSLYEAGFLDSQISRDSCSEYYNHKKMGRVIGYAIEDSKRRGESHIVTIKLTT